MTDFSDAQKSLILRVQKHKIACSWSCSNTGISACCYYHTAVWCLIMLQTATLINNKTGIILVNQLSSVFILIYLQK